MKEGAPAEGGEVLVVPVDGDAVLVAGDAPEPAPGRALHRVPPHRRLLTETAEPVVGDLVHEVAAVGEIDVLGLHGPLLSQAFPGLSGAAANCNF